MQSDTKVSFGFFSLCGFVSSLCILCNNFSEIGLYILFKINNADLNVQNNQNRVRRQSGK